MITNVNVIAHNQEQVDYLNRLWFDSDFESSRKGSGKTGFIANPTSFPIVAYMGGDNLMFGWDFLPTRSRHSGADIEFDEYKRRININKKPTRTEYVKVNDLIFDLKLEFEAGELYFPHSSGWDAIKEEEMFLTRLFENRVYRKVEREITWQDELRVAIQNGRPVGVGSVQVGGVDLTDEQFIEMCHKVYHLTK